MSWKLQTTVLHPQSKVKSLAWYGTTLVDWVSGMAFELDGTTEQVGCSYSYRFDAAIVSPTGNLAVVYEKLGTKALLLSPKCGGILRELDRSYYCANAYEFPIAFVTLPDGAEGLAFCRRAYNLLDIELAESGRCLTDHVARQPLDVFHSRLLQSSGGKWLASAGWVWHPWDVAHVWDLERVLQDPRLLDDPESALELDDEVGSLAFLGDQRLVIATGEDTWADEKRGDRLIAMDPLTRTTLAETSIAGPSGTICRVDSEHLLSLFEHSRLLRAEDGAVIHEWPELHTGRQRSSIIWHQDSIPPFALHPTVPMFAVADGEKITVVVLKPQEG